MNSLEESVVSAMDGSDIELFPFLPYILQDIWEIGSSPQVIIDLIQKHTRHYSALKVLDLGCGKGAVSIKLAKEINCKCLGIDGIQEFILEAKKKAVEYNVQDLCQFEQGDIRKRIKTLTQFHVIILGSIGPVFGDYYSTLTTLSPCLHEQGIIILDDGYIHDDSDYRHPEIHKKEVILQKIKKSGMQLIDEKIVRSEEIQSTDNFIFEKLKQRCYELTEKYPDKSRLFKNYIKNQEKENDIIETKIICSTMVIRK